MMQDTPDFDAPAPERRSSSDFSGGLIVDVDGFEGPLDLLLSLARVQKVDLSKISILALVEQYLAFIDQAREMALDLAADYLVMAAWLAYLKSRLLLPEEKDEPDAREMAAILAFRMQRLDAMRRMSALLHKRDQLGRDIFARGAPEPVVVVRLSDWQAGMHDLLMSYGNARLRGNLPHWRPKPLPVMSMEDAFRRLESLLGGMVEWDVLERFLPAAAMESPLRRSAVASTLGASLELVRSGRLEIRQETAFGPVYLRRRATPRESSEESSQESSMSVAS